MKGSRPRSRAVLAVAALAGWLTAPVPSGWAAAADAWSADLNRCGSDPDKQAAVQACSLVIAHARDPHRLERAYNRRGLANESLGRFEAAAGDFSATIRLNPAIAGYFDNRMRAYKALGKLDLALDDADTAVRMAPTYAFPLHGRGAVRFDMGLYASAVEDYTAALGIDAADAPLLVDRGRALVKLGLTDRALTDFTAAHAVDPAFGPALGERGMTELLVGRRAEAKADLAAALAAGLKDNVAALAYLQLDGRAAAAEPRLVRTAQADLSDAASAGVEAAPLTATQQAEQEAERKLQAAKDAEQARQEAATRLKAERLATAARAAKALVTTAAAFVTANRDDPQLLEYLQSIADLNAALAGVEPAPVERRTAALKAALATDPLYAAYLAQHASEDQREAARSLSDAVRTLAGQKSFLIGVVVQDPASPQAATLLSLAKQTDAVAASADLGRVQTLVGTIDAAIARAGLRASYAAAQQAAAADTRGAKPPRNDPGGSQDAGASP